ncbi:MAG: hypothetical protein ABIJ40_15485 [Bacteroidota bacterium]
MKKLKLILLLLLTLIVSQSYSQDFRAKYWLPASSDSLLPFSQFTKFNFGSSSRLYFGNLFQTGTSNNYLGGFTGLNNTTPFAWLSNVSNATNPNSFNFTNSVTNTDRGSFDRSRDTSSFNFWYSATGSPRLELKDKTGNSLFYVDSVRVSVGASSNFFADVNGDIKVRHAGFGATDPSGSEGNVYIQGSGVANVFKTISNTGVDLLIIKNTGNVGIGTVFPYAQYSQVGSTPIMYLTDSDINTNRTSVATATDTSAIMFDASATQPTITVKNTTGLGFVLSTIAGGGASFNGAFSSGAITMSAGVFTGNALTRGTNSFDTTATTDTVTISGAAIGDYYSITLTGTAAPLAADAIRLEKTTTGFILWRSASGTSGLTYDWFRQK